MLNKVVRTASTPMKIKANYDAIVLSTEGKCKEEHRIESLDTIVEACESLVVIHAASRRPSVKH